MSTGANQPISELHFDMRKVNRLLQHALACRKHRLTLDQRADIYGEDCFDPQDGEETAPLPDGRRHALHLMKNEGICLVSSGLPVLREVPHDRESDVVVCYAEGYDPNINPDCYDDTRAAVGGDDFIEAIEAQVFDELYEICPNPDVFVIGVFEDHFRFAAIERAPTSSVNPS